VRNLHWSRILFNLRYKTAKIRLYRNLRIQRILDSGNITIWNVYRKSHVPDRMVSFSMALSDLWPRFQGHDIYRMVTFPTTLRTPNPVFKVTAFLKSNIGKTARLEDYFTLIGNNTKHMEWYVWWLWLTSNRVARVCQHSGLLVAYIHGGRRGAGHIVAAARHTACF